jgi:hypothetical protein
MNTTELDEKILAYFLLNAAASVNIDGRFRRREEFIQTFEDAFFYSTQKFQGPAAGSHPELCAQLVGQLIDSGCLAASHDKWSGTSYQFDAPRYRTFIKDQIAANAHAQRALVGGPQFWDEVFRAP